MDTDFDKILQELVYKYRTKYSEDAKLLEDTIEAGDAILMYSTLIENANQPSLSTNGKIMHSVRIFYFMGYCMKYNNGIPMLEVLSDWIDNDEKRKVINAVKSQSNLFDVLIEQGVDIKILADYIYGREMIEFAIDEEKKSTGVLKRILERKQLALKNPIPQPLQTILPKASLSVPDWCIIFYYLDDAGNQKGAKIDRIIKFITENDIRNSNGKLTTKGSFKKQYYEIFHRINGTENSKGNKLPPLPPERVENILPSLKNNKKALQTAKNDTVHLLNEIEENKKNDY